MARNETSLTLMLALDPLDWRAEDRLGWATTLVAAIDAAAPHLYHIEGYEIGDTVMYVRLRTFETLARFRRLLREDEDLIRLRARLADLGARMELDIEKG